MNDLKTHFSRFKEQYEVVLFGSQASKTASNYSDYDIAIITRNLDEDFNIGVQLEGLKLYRRNLDIHIFELFPITIQISIIRNYQVIWGDPVEISAYFYSYRKKWVDCRHRILSNQFTHYSERLKKFNHLH